jgi:hypothetical protein
MSGNFKLKKTKKLWFFLGVIVMTNLVVYLTHCCGETILLYISNLFPVLCSLIAAISLILAVRIFREHDFTKIAWLMILIGIIIDFSAETTYAALEMVFSVDMDTVFPTLADYLWCTGYIPVFIGLLMMLIGYKRSHIPMGKIKLLVILSAVFILMFSVVIYFVLMPIVKDAETTGIAKFFYLFYPIGDLFIVTPAVLLMYVTSLLGKGMLSRPWKFLGLGFVCFTISDLLYSYLDWLGKYGNGNLIDIGWNIGYLFIGLSALYQVEMVESINEIE